MRITRWGEYGLLCCLYLARKSDDTAVGATEIAEDQGIPVQYAQQILHRLKKGGIIKSVRGPHGGYKLLKPPKDITLKDILYAAEGRTFEIICDTDPIRPGVCDLKLDCGLKSVWQELKVAIDDLLASHSLSSVAERHQLIKPETLVRLGAGTSP